MRLFHQKAALDRATDLAFVSCWTEFCGPEWENLFLVKGRGLTATPTYILCEEEASGVIDGPSCHPSVMFRRETYKRVGGYRVEFCCGQDWDLWYRLAEIGKFQMVEQALYKARILPSSISANHRARQRAVGKLSRAALRQRRLGLSDEPVLKTVRSVCKRRTIKRTPRASSFYFVGECLRRKNDDRAMNYFKQSIQSSPFLLRAWIRILQHKLALIRRIGTALEL
jgi:hypothetical protein